MYLIVKTSVGEYFLPIDETGLPNNGIGVTNVWWDEMVIRVRQIIAELKAQETVKVQKELGEFGGFAYIPQKVFRESVLEISWELNIKPFKSEPIFNIKNENTVNVSNKQNLTETKKEMERQIKLLVEAMGVGDIVKEIKIRTNSKKVLKT